MIGALAAAAASPHLSIPEACFRAVGPEIILAVGGMVLLVAGSSFRKRRPGVLAFVTLVFLAAAGVAALLGIGHFQGAFDNRIALDGFATFFKVLLVGVGAVAVAVSHAFLTEEDGPQPELYALLLFATVGMMLMASAGDLIVVFVAIETFSLAFYIMAAFRRRRRDSQEASFKYFLTGSFSSAFLLYGIALTYGALGTTRLLGLSSLPAGAIPNRGLLPVGLALVIIGMAFKVAAVPFHNWSPDVYDGSPAPLAGFMAAGAKIAAFAVLLRLLTSAFPLLESQWRPLIVVLAAASMIVGSVVAIAQTNVKRMLAYSSIAHAGFLLIGVAAGTAAGVSGTLFYLVAYSFTILGAFAVVYAVGGPEERYIHLSDYRGLARKRPVMAWALTLLLLSLAGIPPTLGFWAKFFVFGAAVNAHLTPLVVIGVLASAASAFFYLRVVGIMFLDDPEGWSVGAPRDETAPGLRIAVACSLLVLAVGLSPDWLLHLAQKATFLH